MARGREEERVFFFISMCQLARLSIIVMLQDVVLRGERGRTDGKWHWGDELGQLVPAVKC